MFTRLQRWSVKADIWDRIISASHVMKFLGAGGYTEENGAKLKDDILAKTDNITDVLSCIGGMGKPGKVLDVSLDEFKGWTTNLNGHFVAAKTFLPFISDQQDSSYTFITGGGTVYIPNLGCVAIIGSSLLQLSNYIRHEWESKPVRINEVSINVYVTVEPSPGTVINTVAGRGIAAVMMDSNARGKRFVCTN